MNLPARALESCTPPENGLAALAPDALATALAGLPGWQISDGRMHKRFQFANHYEAQAFANAVMWVSHRQDHHPDLAVGYNTVGVTYWTHTVGGVTHNDLVCAAKLELLLAL